MCRCFWLSFNFHFWKHYVHSRFCMMCLDQTSTLSPWCLCVCVYVALTPGKCCPCRPPPRRSRSRRPHLAPLTVLGPDDYAATAKTAVMPATAAAAASSTAATAVALLLHDAQHVDRFVHVDHVVGVHHLNDVVGRRCCQWCRWGFLLLFDDVGHLDINVVQWW